MPHECTCVVKRHRDVLSAYLGTYCHSGVDGVGGSLVLPIDYEADRQLLETSHRLYTQMTSRRGSSFALCGDKRHRSHCCPNEDQYPSENGDGLKVVKNLKSLVGELGSGRNASA